MLNTVDSKYSDPAFSTLFSLILKWIKKKKHSHQYTNNTPKLQIIFLHIY